MGDIFINNVDHNRNLTGIIKDTKCSYVIDGTNLTTAELITIVGMVGLNGQKITIKGLSNKSHADMILIVGMYPNNVTLDFTE